MAKKFKIKTDIDLSQVSLYQLKDMVIETLKDFEFKEEDVENKSFKQHLEEIK